jgi:hypothetical protein
MEIRIKILLKTQKLGTEEACMRSKRTPGAIFFFRVAVLRNYCRSDT